MNKNLLTTAIATLFSQIAQTNHISKEQVQS